MRRMDIKASTAVDFPTYFHSPKAILIAVIGSIGVISSYFYWISLLGRWSINNWDEYPFSKKSHLFQ